MRKLIFILPILFSYLLILGHDIIPHHHHEHEFFVKTLNNKSKEKHHKHHHHKHHHQKQDNEKSNFHLHTENEESHGHSEKDIWGNFFHLDYIFFPYSSSTIHKIPSNTNHYIGFKSPSLLLAQNFSSILLKPPVYISCNYEKVYFKRTFLRGPPFCFS